MSWDQTIPEEVLKRKEDFASIRDENVNLSTDLMQKLM